MIYNGTLQVLKMDTGTLAELTNVTVTLNQETFDTTSKESAGWTEILPGVRSATFSAEGIVDFQASVNKDLADIFAAYTGRTQVALEWTNTVTGDKKLTCNAYITSCEISAPMEDTVTYSIEFASTGAVTPATI